MVVAACEMKVFFGTITVFQKRFAHSDRLPSLNSAYCKLIGIDCAFFSTSYMSCMKMYLTFTRLKLLLSEKLFQCFMHS